MVAIRFASSVSFVVLTFAFGSHLRASEPVPDRPSKAPTVAQPAVRPAVEADLRKLTFTDPLLERRFKSFNKMAETVAERDWHRRPYKTFPGRTEPTVYFAEWATFANKTNRNPINYHGPEECHCLGSTLIFDAKSPALIKEVGFSCRWKPAKTGWSAQVEYRTSNAQPTVGGKSRETFSMRFLHYPPIDDPAIMQHNITIDRGANADHQSHFIVDGIIYEIKVVTWDRQRNQKLMAVQPDGEIRRIMASPESFRDYGVKVFEALAEKVEADFADGSAISSAREARFPAANEDPDTLYSARKMTAKEKEFCLNRARADVNARIKMIKKHYREMYVAANKALPVLDLVSD